MIEVEVKKTCNGWSAKSKVKPDPNDLTFMVGMYNAPIKVEITNPFKLTSL